MSATTFPVSTVMASFLQSPAAFTAAVQSPANASFFLDVSQSVNGLNAAARVFNGALPVEERGLAFPFYTGFASEIQPKALTMAESLGSIHTGYYAVGRRAVLDRITDGTFYPDKKSREAKTERVTRAHHLNHMIAPNISGSLSASALREGLRFERTMSVSDIPTALKWFDISADKGPIHIQLEQIWVDAFRSINDRQMALRTWHYYFSHDCDWKPNLDSLLETAIKTRDVTFREMAVQALAESVLRETVEFQLDFMNRIVGLLSNKEISDDVKVELLNLHNGLLSQLSETGLHAQLANGALTVLDVAANPNIPGNVRLAAGAFGLFAVEAWVPNGARIGRDWTNWMIGNEKDPHMAYAFADHYVRPIAYAYGEIPPLKMQQMETGLFALSSRDLTQEDRDNLWNRMIANQPLWNTSLLYGYLWFVMPKSKRPNRVAIS